MYITQRVDYTFVMNHLLFDFYIPSNQTNAGDCLAAGFIAAALKGLKQDAAVAAGLQAAISCFKDATVSFSLIFASIFFS